MLRNSRRKNAVLWTIQVILAQLFIFAGASKVILPVTVMQQGPVALPGAFLRIVGSLELLGGLGLVLPGIVHFHEELILLAACGLVGVMAGAAVISVESMGVAAAVLPAVVGVLAYVVLAGRGGRQFVLWGGKPGAGAQLAA